MLTHTGYASTFMGTTIMLCFGFNEIIHNVDLQVLFALQSSIFTVLCINTRHVTRACRPETRTRDRIYCHSMRIVWYISRDDRAIIATCSLRYSTLYGWYADCRDRLSHVPLRYDCPPVAPPCDCPIYAPHCHIFAHMHEFSTLFTIVQCNPDKGEETDNRVTRTGANQESEEAAGNVRTEEMITGVEDEGEIRTEERKEICSGATLKATHAYTRNPESPILKEID